MRLLAVDPGDKRIGIALTDPDGIIAYPLEIIHHISRDQDAKIIARLAEDNQVKLILIGYALDVEGNTTPSARKSLRLADILIKNTDIPVKMVDEYGSTNIVRITAREMNLNRRQRRSHRDDIAAVVILQNYLESHRSDNLGDA